MEGAPGRTPTAAQGKEVVNRHQIGLLRWRQFDQLIGIGIGQAIGGPHPAALESISQHGAAAVELHPEAPGRAALPAAQAHGAMGELGRKHRKVAAGQVEAAGAAASLQIEGGARRHEPPGIGDMNPQPLVPLRGGFEGKAVVDVEGVVVVDGDDPLLTAIDTLPIAGEGQVSPGHKLIGLLEQIAGEALLPGGGLQGRQVVALPLAEIDQQVANRAGLEGAVDLPQEALQVVGEGLVRCAAGPAAELVQVVPLLRAEPVNIHGLPGLQPLQPLVSAQAAQGLAAPLLPQRPKFVGAAGGDPGLAEAKESLIAVQPEPAGR